MATKAPIDVLLIENNPTDVRLVQEALRNTPSDHFMVITASTLAQGLEHLASDHVDIVLLDLGLPDSQGLQSLRAVEEYARDLPIVILTISTDEAIGLAAIRAGAQRFFSKDVLTSQGACGEIFPQMISYAIEQKRIEVELRHEREAALRLNREIQFKNEELRILNVELSDRIHERTHELETANEELSITNEELRHYSENLEDLVEERTAQLNDAERLAAIGQTATMIGHDLRNPLQALQLLVDLAEKYYNDVPSEAKEHFDFAAAEKLFSGAEKQIQYMDKIVSDLQDYARPLALECELVSVPVLIDQTLSTLAIPESISTNVEISDSITATIDPHLMQRVLSNLITNAVQAMPTGGALTIGATAEDRAVVLTIHDTGGGVPDNVKDTLFSPLTTGKAKGTGLGLAVVKRIVEAHGGTITFESEEGEGTAFTVRLPQISS